jgi:hypothetical protein
VRLTCVVYVDERGYWHGGGRGSAAILGSDEARQGCAVVFSRVAKLLAQTSSLEVV